MTRSGGRFLSGVWNAPHWCNPKFTSLAKSYDSTVDESSRRKIATSMASIMQDDTPSILSSFLDNSRSFSKKVHGADANFGNIGLLNNGMANIGFGNTGSVNLGIGNISPHFAIDPNNPMMGNYGLFNNGLQNFGIANTGMK